MERGGESREERIIIMIERDHHTHNLSVFTCEYYRQLAIIVGPGEKSVHSKQADP